MGWFNYIGLVAVCAILVPNIIFAIKCKDGFNNVYNNKAVETIEQVGRFSCFGFMVFNIPYTYFGFWFQNAFWIYVGVEACLCAVYCIGWVVLWSKPGILRALLLSITPSLMFMFGGIMLTNIPLICAAAIFAPAHILISYKNAAMPQSKE